jgi:hypothetical protein
MFQNPTANLNALGYSNVKMACCSSESISASPCVGSSIQNASKQFVCCIQLSFVNFALHLNLQSKIYRS